MTSSVRLLRGASVASFVVLWVTLMECSTDSGVFLFHPVPSILLEPGQHRVKALICVFKPASRTDVIGWVVNGIRISNNMGKLMSSARTRELVTKYQLAYYETNANDSLEIGYEIDFFDVSHVLTGSYKCQLCSNTSCADVIAESSVSKVMVRWEPSGPPTCMTSLSSRVILGEPVTLSCASEPGLPVVELEWRRGMELILEQEDPVVQGETLYNNVTLKPSVTDTNFTCYMMTSSMTQLSCSVESFTLVSTPRVLVTPLSAEVLSGSSGTYTCSARGETGTSISSYTWSVEDIPASRIAVNGSSITIHSVTVSDHLKVIQCEATDDQNMKGFGQYPVLVYEFEHEGKIIAIATGSAAIILVIISSLFIHRRFVLKNRPKEETRPRENSSMFYCLTSESPNAEETNTSRFDLRNTEPDIDNECIYEGCADNNNFDSVSSKSTLQIPHVAAVNTSFELESHYDKAGCHLDTEYLYASSVAEISADCSYAKISPKANPRLPHVEEVNTSHFELDNPVGNLDARYTHTSANADCVDYHHAEAAATPNLQVSKDEDIYVNALQRVGRQEKLKGN